ERLWDRAILEELRHHRRRRLADRAAPADEADIPDHVVRDAQLQVDLISAQGIVERDRMRRPLERALVTGAAVVIENQLLVERAESRLRRGRIQRALPP